MFDIKGRDRPFIAQVAAGSQGVTIRIDFALRDEGWVELALTYHQLEHLLSQQLVPQDGYLYWQQADPTAA